MKLLDYYIGKTILGTICLITLLLIGLQIFILFVSQLDSLGRGDYNIWRALLYILLKVPYQVYLFFPVACLLGSLLGLGILASNSELVVFRAAGVSIARVFIAVMKTALVLILLVTLLGETVIPKMVRTAEAYRIVATSGGNILTTGQGVWLREQDSFIHVGQIVSANELLDISQYEFNSDQVLQLVRIAKRAELMQGHWMLIDVSESIFHAEAIETQTYPSLNWDVALNSDLLALGSTEPEEMSLLEIHRYLASDYPNLIDVGLYRLSFWKRIIQPLATCMMIFLSIPFIFGPLRSATLGSRFMAGATVGFGFYIIDKFFGPFSLFYQFPPLASALIPSLLFAALGWVMLRWVK